MTGAVTVGASPAHADSDSGRRCRATFDNGAFRANVCARRTTKVESGQATTTFFAWGSLGRAPSNCSFFRVYINIQTNEPDERFWSSGAFPCSYREDVDVSPATINERSVAELVAFDAAGNELLAIQSPEI